MHSSHIRGGENVPSRDKVKTSFLVHFMVAHDDVEEEDVMSRQLGGRKTDESSSHQIMWAKYPPKYNRFITTAENCEGLGNQVCVCVSFVRLCMRVSVICMTVV